MHKHFIMNFPDELNYKHMLFSVQTFIGILCIIYRSMLSESDFRRCSGNLGAFILYVAFIFSVGVRVSLSIFII